jgi:hypothetical protein
MWYQYAFERQLLGTFLKDRFGRTETDHRMALGMSIEYCANNHQSITEIRYCFFELRHKPEAGQHYEYHSESR